MSPLLCTAQMQGEGGLGLPTTTAAHNGEDHLIVNVGALTAIRVPGMRTFFLRLPVATVGAGV